MLRIRPVRRRRDTDRDEASGASTCLTCFQIETAGVNGERRDMTREKISSDETSSELKGSARGVGGRARLKL